MKEKASKELHTKENKKKDASKKESITKEKSSKEVYNKERNAKDKTLKAAASKKLLEWQSQPACGKWLGWGPEALNEPHTIRLVGKDAHVGQKAHFRVELKDKGKTWKAKRALEQPAYHCNRIKGCRWTATGSAEAACLGEAPLP